jgi:hypothetical protein
MGIGPVFAFATCYSVILRGEDYFIRSRQRCFKGRRITLCDGFVPGAKQSRLLGLVGNGKLLSPSLLSYLYRWWRSL